MWLRCIMDCTFAAKFDPFSASLQQLIAGPDRPGAAGGPDNAQEGPRPDRPRPLLRWEFTGWEAQEAAQSTYLEDAVFGIRVQVAERPVPSARTLPSPRNCSRASRIVWSLTPGTAVLMSARRNVAGA